MIKLTELLLFASLALVCYPAVLRGDDKFAPDDPIAAIDGDPIYLGELNLVLTQRLKVRDLDRVGIEVQQATAALLVRRHLAMKSLRAQGGAALESMIRRQIETFAAEAKRRGSSLSQQAAARMADEQSFKADLAWQTAWTQYLKSKLTDANLRRYFQQHRQRYAGSRWEASHLFLKMDMRDRASVENAEQSLADLAKQIVASENAAEAFADAARQHSDAGSAGDGGMVGWVSKDGDLPGSVMAAVRETAVGQIGGPVRSPLGIHLVFVHRQEVGNLAYEDLDDQAQLRRDAADALFDALVSQQSDAKIQWFVPALRPPPGVKILP